MKFTLSEKLKFAKMHVNDLVPLFEISEKYGIKVGNPISVINIVSLVLFFVSFFTMASIVSTPGFQMNIKS